MSGGKCQLCGVKVGLAFRLMPKGWVVDGDFLRHPDGREIALATKEHLVPRSKGGTNHFRNLRIYCMGCNHEAERLVTRGDTGEDWAAV